MLFGRCAMTYSILHIMPLVREMAGVVAKFGSLACSMGVMVSIL